MSGSRVLWGQITIVVVIVLAAIWGATEWTAWRLGFQAQLGAPWFELGGWPVYYPPLFFWWWYSYDAYAPAIFVEGAIIAVSGGFLSIAVAITLSIIRAREAKNVATYGSARWASPEEVTAAGLLGPDGVVLGKLNRDYLRHDGPEHVLCFAPTRSGKGVGLVVPTLLTWPGSVIVHDIKGENWSLTARSPPPTIRCWKSGVAIGRCATFRTSPTSWSIPKARSTSGTIGKRPAIRCWSA